MKTIHPSRLLKLSLAADAAATLPIAVLQLAAASELSTLLALPQRLLTDTGIFLLAYTALLVLMTRSARLPAGLVGLVIGGNLAWAAGCVLLLATGWLTPSPLGLAFVAVHAVATLAFAVLEYRGLGRSAPQQPRLAARA